MSAAARAKIGAAQKVRWAKARPPGTTQPVIRLGRDTGAFEPVGMRWVTSEDWRHDDHHPRSHAR